MISGKGMMNNFRKLSFGERVKNTGFLLKHSFKVVGKDKDIIKPTIRIIIFSTIITAIIFASILTFLTGTLVGLGILGVLVSIFILLPITFFYYTRQKACQSWVVYNTICGKDISYADSKQHTKSEKSKLRKIALLDLVMAYAKSQKNNRKGGFIGIIINLFFSALIEIWDLLSHYLIPAVVIEQKPIMELVPKIKSMKNNVPAALAGVFGIDFVGNVIGRLLAPINLIVFAIAAFIGIGLGSVLPGTTITLSGYTFSWVPIFIVLFLQIVISKIVKHLVAAVKVIYFTIFYTTIMRPNKIAPAYRKELTDYIKMKQQ